MVNCPVCEYAQEGGGECAVCGKRLQEVEPQGAAVTRLPDLEPTVLEGRPPAPVERISDLDPTRHEATPAPPDEPVAWLERTSPAPGPPAPDLFAQPTCRYCRTPTSPGDVFCSRCGLKLTVYARETPAPPSADVRRCRFCGAAGAGLACPACGARFAGEP